MRIVISCFMFPPYHINGIKNVNVAVPTDEVDAYKAINDTFEKSEDQNPAQFKVVKIEGDKAIYSKTNFNYTPVKHYSDNYSLTEEFGYGLSQYVALVGAIGYGWMSDDTNMFGEDRGLSNLSLAAQVRTIANWQ